MEQLFDAVVELVRLVLAQIENPGAVVTESRAGVEPVSLQSAAQFSADYQHASAHLGWAG